MGIPKLRCCGLFCDSSAGYKLQSACGTGRQPTLGWTLGFSQSHFPFGILRSEIPVGMEGRGGSIVFLVDSWTQNIVVKD